MSGPEHILDFADAGAWEAWLEDHHRDTAEAWLRIVKRRANAPGLSIEEALDGALCFGWIDGQRRSCDDVSFLQRYSPRRATSSWSQVNVEKFETLLAAGRVRPAGLAAVEAAKADGRWEQAYASQRSAEVPPDLAAALAENARAGAAFTQLGRSERYAIILPLLKARTAKRRADLLHRAIAMLEASVE